MSGRNRDGVVDEVMANLYLGSLEAAHRPDQLQALGLTRFVNVTAEHPPAPGQHASTLVVPVVDQPQARLLEHFNHTNSFIEAGMAAGTATLVHCQHGVSRSASVVLAYLMLHHRWRLSEAWAYLRTRRPEVEPNSGFLAQLRAYEQRIFGDITSLERFTFLDAQRVDPRVDDGDPEVALQALAARCSGAEAVLGREVDACVAQLRLSTSEVLLKALPGAAGHIWQTYGGLWARDRVPRESLVEVLRRLSALSHPPLDAVEAALDAMVDNEAWEDLRLDVPRAATFLVDLRLALGLSRGEAI